MRKHDAFILLFLFGLRFFTNAQSTKGQSVIQDNAVVLSDDEKELFKERTLEKVNDFQNSLSLMSSKNLTADEKKVNKEVAAELFINKGITVVMEVSYRSTVTGEISKKNRPLLAYFDNLCNLPYATIEFRTAKACHVSNWYQKGTDSNGNPVYEATATYYQEFIGYRKDGNSYHDITQKTVRVEIRWSTDLAGARWVVLLGDVGIVETK